MAGEQTVTARKLVPSRDNMRREIAGSVKPRTIGVIKVAWCFYSDRLARDGVLISRERNSPMKAFGVNGFRISSMQSSELKA